MPECDHHLCLLFQNTKEPEQNTKEPRHHTRSCQFSWQVGTFRKSLRPTQGRTQRPLSAPKLLPKKKGPIFAPAGTHLSLLQGQLSSGTQNFSLLQGHLSRATQNFSLLQGHLSRATQNFSLLQGQLSRATRNSELLQGQLSRATQNSELLQGQLMILLRPTPHL